MAPDGTIVDEVTYIDQVTDVSYGRYPNGIGEFQSMSPTFNAENTGTTATSDPFTKQQEIKVYPNPANDSFTLSIDGETEEKQIVMIYNLNGTKVYQGMIRQNHPPYLRSTQH